MEPMIMKNPTLKDFSGYYSPYPEQT